MLTQKQKDNRAYYARHTEKIRAKKREAYHKTKTNKPPEIKPVRRQMPDKEQKIQYSNQDKLPDKKPTQKTITPEDDARREARRRIEDWHLARELEIESF